MPEKKVITKEDVIYNLIKNYKDLEISIVNQLNMRNRLHPTTTGTSREDIWLELFERIVPKKFVIEHSVFIIDSCQNVSREVDLAIIDNTYTPYIFQYGRLKYVPIEAVSVVVECKSSRVPWGKTGIEDWCRHIESLRTSRNAVTRIATGTIVKGVTYTSRSPADTSTQTSTRPIRIFCGIDIGMSDQRKLEKLFDFLLIARNGSDKKEHKIEIITKGKESLNDWYMELEHNGKNDADSTVLKADILKSMGLEKLKVEYDGDDVSLLTFNLQLNQLLMLINNPMPFPHFAYANMFNGLDPEAE